MIKKDVLEKTSAWPFVEAKKMLRERKTFIEKKGKITLQTGYGPSGLPHIGTFGEVARTSMMVNALNQLTDLPTEIITFSDDMDGLRKVPDNVPNQELLQQNLHKPLTQVPDPFQKFNSFGEHGIVQGIHIGAHPGNIYRKLQKFPVIDDRYRFNSGLFGGNNGKYL